MRALTKNNEISLIRNGAEFIKANINLIEQAKNYILLHTYIFTVDKSTQPIINSLILASQRGIKVYLILDAFGSSDFPQEAIDDLRSNGINFTFFRPLIQLNHIGRRLHQKMLLIDNTHALIGGINISGKYNIPDLSKPWLDYSCLVEGEEVKNIQKKVTPIYKKHFNNFNILYTTDFNFNFTKPVLIKTNENDWMRYKQEIFRSYLKAINAATSEVIILATYFVPSKKLLASLSKASKRGVKIKLIFGEIADQKLTSLSADYYYQWYLDNNIQIYEWDKSVIHGKLALVDNKWVTIGSYNHNYISRFGNLELNLEIINLDFAKIISEEFRNIIDASKEITHTNLDKTIGNKFKIYIIYLLTNLITFLSIILIFKRKEDPNSDFYS